MQLRTLFRRVELHPILAFTFLFGLSDLRNAVKTGHSMGGGAHSDTYSGTLGVFTKRDMLTPLLVAIRTVCVIETQL